jgi:hypothetical protein
MNESIRVRLFVMVQLVFGYKNQLKTSRCYVRRRCFMYLTNFTRRQKLMHFCRWHECQRCDYKGVQKSGMTNKFCKFAVQVTIFAINAWT